MSHFSRCVNALSVTLKRASLEGAIAMHSPTRHRRRHGASGEAEANTTKGLVLNDGWRYDLLGWFHDTFSSRGALRKLRQRTIRLASLQPGEQALDVGCGTGTLALEAARYLSPGGSITGIDPGIQQIARARAKAAKRHVPQVSIEFKTGVIEQTPVSRSGARCGLLHPDDAPLADTSQAPGTRRNRPRAQTWRAAGHRRFCAQTGTRGPRRTLSGWGEPSERS